VVAIAEKPMRIQELEKVMEGSIILLRIAEAEVRSILCIGFILATIEKMIEVPYILEKKTVIMPEVSEVLKCFYEIAEVSLGIGVNGNISAQEMRLEEL
jgi:predicted transcriptional regulator